MRYGLARHLLSIALLPFVVTVVIPLWLARRSNVGLSIGSTPSHLLVQLVGLVVSAVGFVLFVTSLGRFAAEGQGTLAPWDPPRHLVVRGPYRYVRNPMISGVVFILLGQTLILMSASHLIWAVIFIAMNLIYIPLFEEPQLQKRFDGEYVEYCRNVPRLLPRLQPYKESSGG